MALSDPVDIYCERMGPELWAEPLNVATNLAFFLAAYASWRLYRRSIGPGYPHRRELLLLLLLVVMVATGSSLFHLFAARWAMLADILPIALFELTGIAILLRRVLYWRPAAVAGGILAFLGLAFALRASPLHPWMHGSEMYLAIFAVMLPAALTMQKHGRKGGVYLAQSMAVFACSLFFRTMDMPVCERLPIGTHFLWHMCNGAVMYLFMKGVILGLRPQYSPEIPAREP